MHHPHYDLFILAFIFFAVEHFVIIIRVILQYAVADVPQSVHEHIERQQHVVDVLINDIEEEDEEFREADEIDAAAAEKWTYDKINKNAPADRKGVESKGDDALDTNTVQHTDFTKEK